MKDSLADLMHWFLEQINNTRYGEISISATVYDGKISKVRRLSDLTVKVEKTTKPM